MYLLTYLLTYLPYHAIIILQLLTHYCCRVLYIHTVSSYCPNNRK